MQKQIAAGFIAGALVIAGAGATLILPGIAAAADPTASPTTTTATSTPTGSTGTTTSATPDRDGDGRGHGGMGRGGHGCPGGLDADDLTAAAGVPGMTEADLTTALTAGNTTAQVATNKGVALQKVIDAIVAADTAAIKAEVTAGTMTQAQADARITNLAAHVTDEVNAVHTDNDADGTSPDASPAPTATTSG